MLVKTCIQTKMAYFDLELLDLHNISLTKKYF